MAGILDNLDLGYGADGYNSVQLPMFGDTSGWDTIRSALPQSAWQQAGGWGADNNLWQLLTGLGLGLLSQPTWSRGAASGLNTGLSLIKDKEDSAEKKRANALQLATLQSDLAYKNAQLAGDKESRSISAYGALPPEIKEQTSPPWLTPAQGTAQSPSILPPAQYRAQSAGLEAGAKKEAENAADLKDKQRVGQGVFKVADFLEGVITKNKDLFNSIAGPTTGAAAQGDPLWNPSRYAYEARYSKPAKALISQVTQYAAAIKSQIRQAQLKGQGAASDQDAEAVYAILDEIPASRSAEEAVQKLQTAKQIMGTWWGLDAPAPTPAYSKNTTTNGVMDVNEYFGR